MLYDENVERFLEQYSLEDILSGVIEMQMLLYGKGEDTEKIIKDALMLQEASDEEKEKFLASTHMKVKSMAFRGDGSKLYTRI